jgi:hypothetical protein
MMYDWLHLLVGQYFVHAVLVIIDALKGLDREQTQNRHHPFHDARRAVRP